MYFRLVFGGHVGPFQRTLKTGSVELHYEGLKLKGAAAKAVLPTATTTTPSTTVTTSTPLVTKLPDQQRGHATSPILKAHLSSPTKPETPNKAVEANPQVSFITFLKLY